MAMTLLFIFSLFGFGVSFYIFFKKKRGEKLVCILGEDCEKVVNSKYNKIFGIPNEIIGMGYYAFIALDAMFLQSARGTEQQGSGFSLLVSGCAALFSLYLLGIQVFVLKEWCEYCVATALISIGIFAIIFSL